ncbi:MAG: ABC transporter ATP-binding protein [Deltaproteobacteria bacterium]|nr:ABC transporter ATP-binding protein [Deltaproteobacteria bacterium]
MSILSVRRLSKSFGGLTAVPDLSLELEAGEILGLIGPNGAGKTTVFNCISGFLPPDSGEILLDGASIRGRKPSEICRMGLARTFQIVRPFLGLTVFENVLVGALVRERSLARAEQEVREIVQLTGLEPFSGAEAGSLPLPVRKRLELAKALATNPRVLLLDEVMGGLVPSEVEEIIGLIRRIRAAGVAVLMIEHVMQGVMALAQRVLVINYGVKIAEGSPEEVVRNQDVIEAYLGKEFARARG